MKKPNPVTPEDGDKFQTYIEKWQRNLNLGDWRIVRSPNPAKGAMAEVSKRDLAQKLAVYRIGVDFGATPVTARSLEETAVHELLHVFLFPLLEAARDPHTSAETLDSLEHSVINVLEKLLVDRSQ